MPVGQPERITQKRVINLFSSSLGYSYLGNWEYRENNRNIEEGMLRGWLAKQGYSPALIDKALYKLDKEANDQSKSLYDRNQAVYSLLRYGVAVKADISEKNQTIHLIDWKNPENNDFALAEEVTLPKAHDKAHGKRPDIVLYVNGIALAVLELKRSTVSVAEGIRQNLDSQKPIFCEHFFSTVQLIIAGNDSEGLRYGVIQTTEKYYLAWKDDGQGEKSPLDRALVQLCGKERFLELIYDFMAFDAGTKKICRHNQYFGVKAAQDFVRRREGGIIWHTQGSGKSLTMVWLAKWIRENRQDARVLIITDRTELDEQIEKVFTGVSEKIYRARSGADLIINLRESNPWLICSLVHKFGNRREDGATEEDARQYIEELKKSLSPDFKAKGDIYVFVDECHRSHTGDLHKAMKAILPNAMFIGFTGTPLLKSDKQKSIEVFGRYIHTYKFDEAVRDKVVLDLRYEARDIDQRLTSPQKVDQWFTAKTSGLTDIAKAQLKQRWGTMQKVLSSRDRLCKIVEDILLDMEIRDRLKSGYGNAILVSGSVYQACKLYEMFCQTPLKGKCAIVTSYRPIIADTKGEDGGEGPTEKLRKYEIYKSMLADWFSGLAPEEAVNKADQFEIEVKKKFIEHPGQMKLLIVVNKLLTGFDAPPATYLYIDQNMQDHGLFQAICRVNRLDGEDKEYGYIIDYKDLFKSLEGAVHDYTSGAFDNYAKEDVAGLLEDRLKKAKERLEEVREALKALCEPVRQPRDITDYFAYFCCEEPGNAEQLKANETKRLSLYKLVASFIRAYANLAGEFEEAGYSKPEQEALKAEAAHYENARTEIKLASGDYVDLKIYEPAMRHLIDTYISADDSRKVSAFDDMSLIQLIVERGDDAIKSLPENIQKNPEAVAEVIENNMRRLILDEHPVNPKYYDEMSKLLDALIEQRRQQALDYQKYLRDLVAFTTKITQPQKTGSYPSSLNSAAKRALYDNLDKNEELTLRVDEAVRKARQDGWRNNQFKAKKIRFAIQDALDDNEELALKILELARHQYEY